MSADLPPPGNGPAREFVAAWMRHHLAPHFHYHNWTHTLMVTETALDLARLLHLPPHDIHTLELAALFHDTGWAHDPDAHEAASADIARQLLPSLGIDAATTQQAASLILATRLPQRPASPLEELLCDADLAYLASDDYPARTVLLRLELQERGTVYTDTAWLHLQRDFLSQHRFFTRPARSRLEPGLSQNLARIQSLLPPPPFLP